RGGLRRRAHRVLQPPGGARLVPERRRAPPDARPRLPAPAPEPGRPLPPRGSPPVPALRALADRRRPPPVGPAGGASRCPLCPLWLSTLVSPGILCRLTRRARGRAQGVRGPEERRRLPRCGRRIAQGDAGE